MGTSIIKYCLVVRSQELMLVASEMANVRSYHPKQTSDLVTCLWASSSVLPPGRNANDTEGFVAALEQLMLRAVTAESSQYSKTECT